MALGRTLIRRAFQVCSRSAATCAKEVADLVPDRIVECVDDRRERWMSEAELRKAKRMITVNAIEQLQTVKGVASDLGLNWLYARNLEFSRQYLERLQSVHRSGRGTGCCPLSHGFKSYCRGAPPGEMNPKQVSILTKQGREPATSRSE